MQLGFLASPAARQELLNYIAGAIPPLPSVNEWLSSIPLPPVEELLSKEKIIAIYRRRRKRQKSLRNKARTARGPRCQRCGSRQRVEQHHIVPLALAQRLPELNIKDPDNLIDLCAVCHKYLEEATETLVPALHEADRWAQRHPLLVAEFSNGSRLRARDLQQSLVEWAMEQVVRLPNLVDAYRTVVERFLGYQPPLNDRKSLVRFLQTFRADNCQRCGATEAQNLRVYSIVPPKALVRLVGDGYDPLKIDRATICLDCANELELLRGDYQGWAVDPPDEVISRYQQIWNKWMSKN